MPDRLTTYAELFAGGGGYGIAANELGLKPLFAIERDRPTAYIHHLNNPECPMYTSPIEDLDPQILLREYGAPDILFASPPCQGWSKSRGGGRRHKDTDIATDILRYVEILSPKIFFLENVTQFVQFQLFRDFLIETNKLGYRSLVSLIEMAAFGVPQTRHRAIVTFVRKDTNLKPIDPYAAAPANALAGQSLMGWYPTVKGLLPGMPSDAIPESIRAIMPNPDNMVASFNMMVAESQRTRMRMGERLVKVNNDPNHIQAIAVQIGHAARKKITYRTNLQPIFTVVASIAKQPTRILNADGSITRMSMRANARLQTIPDWYRIPLNQTLAGKIVGNAIPPLFVRKLLELYLV